MDFSPRVGDSLEILEVTYRFVRHPAVAAMPVVWSQSGRFADVYTLAADDRNWYALKVFRQAYRTPLLADVALQLNRYSDLPGLRACQRIVLTPDEYSDLIQQFPDLTYAALMPWVSGEPWQVYVIGRRE